MCLLINRLTSRPISRTACFLYGLLPYSSSFSAVSTVGLRNLFMSRYIFSVPRSAVDCDCRCGCPNVSVWYLRPINLRSAFSLSISLAQSRCFSRFSLKFEYDINAINSRLCKSTAYIYRCICICCRCFSAPFCFLALFTTRQKRESPKLFDL